MSFYKMERGWMDNDMFQDEAYSTRTAWMWLIEAAAWKDTIVNIGGKPVSLKRGQLSYSIRFMAEKFQWSNNKLIRFIERLKLWGMVTTDTNTAQSIITICNYSKYQDDKRKTNTDTNTQADTGSNTDADTEANTNKKNLRNKEVKNILDIAPQSVAEIPEIIKPEKKKGTRLPADWVLPDAWGDWGVDYCSKKGLGNATAFVIEQGGCFKRYWISSTGKGATKLDWEATWQNWIIRGLPGHLLNLKRMEREKSYEQVRRSR